jgi:hypothetical protein
MAGRSEWRGLSRALRSGRRYQEPSGWSALAGWIWRHLPELFVVLLVVMVWRWLAGFVGGLLAVLPLAALLAGALAWAPSRTVLAVVAGWRLTRHRLRAGLLEARVTTPSGRLPVYLGSWPTSVGERVWLWCPPGIAAEDLEDETERLRAACIAREIRVNRDVRFSALVAVDVIRRDTLSAKKVIPAPITDHVHKGQAESSVDDNTKANKEGKEVKTNGRGGGARVVVHLRPGIPRSGRGRRAG